MSLRTSEENYIKAKAFYKAASDLFYTLENYPNGNEAYLSKEILENSNQLEKCVARVNMYDLATSYCEADLVTFKKKLEEFKETAFYMKRTVTSMQAFDRVRPAIMQYMKHVDWFSVGRSEKDAADAISRFITEENNYEHYKGIINSIVKGSMGARAFSHLFESVKARIPKKSITL